MIGLGKKAAKGSFWNFFDRVINQIGYLLLIIYLANLLSPSDLGLIALVSVFVIFAETISNGGLSQALVQKSHSATEEDFSTIFYTNFIISICLYYLFYISTPTIAFYFDEPDFIFSSRILFLIVILNSLSIVPRSKLQIEVDFKTQAIINSVSMIISIFVALIAAIYLKN